MASCQSLTSQLIKVSGDFLNCYQDFRKDADEIYVDAIIPGKSDSEKALNKLIDDAFQLQTDLLTSYGKLTREGSGKIGARDLLIPTDKFEYTVEVEGEFNKEAMEDLAKQSMKTARAH